MAQYAPTSGTEAMDFIGKWCGRCRCDENEDCDVLAVGSAYGLGALIAALRMAIRARGTNLHRL